jgi:hypothetical protein
MSTAIEARAVWTPASWKAFWSNPTPEIAAARVPQVVTPDIVGVWPRASRHVNGVDAYTRRIVDVLRLLPDFRVTLEEQATNGEFTFLRWSATGHTPDGDAFRAIGCDRVRLRDGRVCENLIISDHEIFAMLAREIGDA